MATQLNLLTASLDLGAVKLLRAAMNSGRAAGRAAAAVTAQPAPRIRPAPHIEPRQRIQPAPRFEPRPVHRPEPALATPGVAVIGTAPAELVGQGERTVNPIQPPWKVLPCPVTRPAAVHVKLHRPPPDIHLGRMIDLFI